MSHLAPGRFCTRMVRHVRATRFENLEWILWPDTGNGPILTCMGPAHPVHEAKLPICNFDRAPQADLL